MSFFVKVPLAFLAFSLPIACLGGALGGAIGGVKFTTDDFADVPAYPDATQTTESNTTLNTMTMFFKFIPGTGEWKHYVTSDSESDVLDWYAEELPEQGWGEVTEEDMPEIQTQSENGVFYFKDDTMLVIFAASGIDDGDDTHILIGRIKLEEE